MREFEKLSGKSTDPEKIQTAPSLVFRGNGVLIRKLLREETKQGRDVKMGSWRSDEQRKKVRRKSSHVSMGSFHQSPGGER